MKIIVGGIDVGGGRGDETRRFGIGPAVRLVFLENAVFSDYSSIRVGSVRVIIPVCRAVVNICSAVRTIKSEVFIIMRQTVDEISGC